MSMWDVITHLRSMFGSFIPHEIIWCNYISVPYSQLNYVNKWYLTGFLPSYYNLHDNSDTKIGVSHSLKINAHEYGVVDKYQIKTDGGHD